MKITSCRIKDSTKKKLQYVQTVIKIEEEINNNNKSVKYSEDETINISLNKLLESMGIEMKEEITDRSIRGMEGVLKKERIDNNFKPKNKRILKSLSEALFDEGIVPKKLGYDETLTVLINYYLEAFPKLKKYTFRERDIDQQFRTKELLKKNKGDRYY